MQPTVRWRGFEENDNMTPHSTAVQDWLDLAQALDAMAADLPIATAGDEALTLNNYGRALGGAASNIRLVAVQATLAQTAEPLAQIRQATEDARQAIKKIARISSVIAIVGDVLLLANVVGMQKWPLVAPTLKHLKDDLAKL
jgi:hypothetical protein